MTSATVAVQGTNDDATVSKLSASTNGYYSDPFLPHFVSASHRTKRAPLINRGYYARVAAISSIVDQFIATHMPPPQPQSQTAATADATGSTATAAAAAGTATTGAATTGTTSTATAGAAGAAGAAGQQHGFPSRPVAAWLLSAWPCAAIFVQLWRYSAGSRAGQQRGASSSSLTSSAAAAAWMLQGGFNRPLDGEATGQKVGIEWLRK